MTSQRRGAEVLAVLHSDPVPQRSGVQVRPTNPCGKPPWTREAEYDLNHHRARSMPFSWRSLRTLKSIGRLLQHAVHEKMKIGKYMARLADRLLLIAVLMLFATQVRAEPLEYIGKPVRGIPVSQAVKVAKFVFVSGTPAFDGNGKLAVGDFPAQMKQVMDNLTATLKASGAGWDRVVKANVLLMRTGDFAEMNRIYATYFADGKYPARTTVVVAGLPHPDFLLEIECEALAE